jgi:hypothetical protein
MIVMITPLWRGGAQGSVVVWCMLTDMRQHTPAAL